MSVVVFTQGCNFQCPYCHNPQLLAMAGSRGGMRPDAPSYDDTMAFLRKRAALLDGVVISGGEATLQPGLADFCRAVKELGYAVKLDTNGSRPQIVEQLVTEALLDYVALDVKTLPERYDGYVCRESGIHDALLDTMAILSDTGVSHEFRTTCAAPIVTEETLEALARILPSGAVWFLQKVRLDTAMESRGLSALGAGVLEDMAGRARDRGIQASVR